MGSREFEMNIGMMWLITNPKLSLEENILAAREYYFTKYGKTPTVCEVNKSQIDKRSVIAVVDVTPVRYILPNLIWIGEK